MSFQYPRDWQPVIASLSAEGPGRRRGKCLYSLLMILPVAGTSRSCRISGTPSTASERECRFCGATLRLPKGGWFGSFVDHPWMMVFASVMAGVSLIAYLLQADILYYASLLITAVVVWGSRIYYRQLRKRPAEWPDVRQLFHRRIVVSLDDPRVGAFLGTRRLNGTVVFVVEFGRRNEIVVRLDTSLNLSRRVWDLAALFPAGISRHMAELLRNEVIVRINLVPPRHVNKLKGKLLAARREKGSFSISLGPGRAILPGILGR